MDPVMRHVVFWLAFPNLTAVGTGPTGTDLRVRLSERPKQLQTILAAPLA